MQAHIKKLVELQAVDVRLTGLRRAVAAFPARLAEIEARLASAKKLLADARAAHTTSLTDRKKFELDVEQWKEKAKKYRDQSYEVKTNDAFRALQHEIANAEKEMARAEDRLLERMVSGEEFDRQIKTAEAALKEAEAVAAREKSALAEERAAEEAKLAAAEAERAGVVAGIPETLLAEYQRVAKSRGTALAEVIGEICHACGMHVRPHVYQELRRAGNEETYHCETCGRILYYPEPAAPASLQPPASTDGTNSSDGTNSPAGDAPNNNDAANSESGGELKSAAQATTGGQ
jgi:predicted  nucleic acid-binding Zn-ribbon protein